MDLTCHIVWVLFYVCLDGLDYIGLALLGLTGLGLSIPLDWLLDYEKGLTTSYEFCNLTS